MNFARCFKKALPTTDNPLFKLLYNDIKAGDEKRGIVFPALRVNELDFYCGGGVLFENNGTSFKRNPAYNKKLKAKIIAEGTKNISPIAEEAFVSRHGLSFVDNYEAFKKENIEHFNKEGKPDERQYLERLYKHTYIGGCFPEICVLDIEIRFNVNRSQKKCDMILLNFNSREIMFVEGKLFADSRMSCGENDDRKPEVVEQVITYNNLINSLSSVQNIENQYANYIAIMSELFFGQKTELSLRLLPSVKLLVYETPTHDEIMTKQEYRGRRSLKKQVEDTKIASLWIETGKEDKYTLSKIWDALYE